MRRSLFWTHTSASRYSLILAIIAALIFSVALAGPAAAAPPDRYSSRTTNLYFDAYSPETGVSVFLFQESGVGYILCANTPTGLGGCTEVSADAVTIAGDLSSVTIAPTTIPVYECSEFECTQVDEITVAATFTATGEATKFQNRFKSSNGCKVMGSSKGIQREGEATISIDGTEYEGFGFLTQATETFRVQCKR